jgi:4-amino-4-deoxy-L-arabinose transferase-like glycosyltransferase
MTFADRAPPGDDDSSQRMLSMIALIVFHVLVWWCVYGLARSNLDAQGDMVETFAWGQSWQWGYWKHPPLSSWVSGAWFAVMPQTDVSYALLASVNAAVGLLGVHAMAREFVDRRWMLACTAAAALTPGLTILAMRFNANALLLSTWPWAIACFARAMASKF